jgi:hypothetical protein
MDAGSIFLICFVVAFSLLLTGGWWFGYPLLMCAARRGTSRQRGGIGASQDERSSVVGRPDLSSRRHLTLHQSATSPSSTQLRHCPRASPASSITSIFSGTKSSCGVHKATELDILKDPHDLYNMIPVPPVPKRSLGRHVAEIGTQVSVPPSI